MATSRSFAYNTGSPISGTDQVGNLAVSVDLLDYTISPGGVQWWQGPDEELGYVIAHTVPNDTQPTSVADYLYLDPSRLGNSAGLSNNNQTVIQQFGYIQSTLGTKLIGANDQVMFSVLVSLGQPATLPDSHFIGIGKATMNYNGITPDLYSAYPGNDDKSMGYRSNGTIWYNGNEYASGLQSWGDDDLIDIVINNNVNGMWVRVNGGYWNNNATHNPETNVGGIEIINAPFYPALCPGYVAEMTIQNSAAYGTPRNCKLLGDETAAVGFNRSTSLTESSFIEVANSVSGQTFTTGSDASTWLTTNGYWNNYQQIVPVVSLDAATYSGTGPWVDSIGSRNFMLFGSPTWSSSNGGYFTFNPANSQYAQADSLESLTTWSVGVWHYYDGTNNGSLPCIVTETFIGGTINYSIGDNTGAGLSSGLFDGGAWQTSGSYGLTAGNWYYIVGTYDGTANNLYINNILVASNNYTGTPATSGAGIRLMTRWDSSDYWGGKLAKVDIYDFSLNSTQIGTLWNSTKSRFGL